MSTWLITTITKDFAECEFSLAPHQVLFIRPILPAADALYFRCHHSTEEKQELDFVVACDPVSFEILQVKMPPDVPIAQFKEFMVRLSCAAGSFYYRTQNPKAGEIKKIAVIGGIECNFTNSSVDSHRLTETIFYCLKSGIAIDPNFTVDVVTLSEGRDFLKEQHVYDLVILAFIFKLKLRSENTLLINSELHTLKNWTNRIEQSGAKLIVSYGGTSSELTVNILNQSPSLSVLIPAQSSMLNSLGVPIYSAFAINKAFLSLLQADLVASKQSYTTALAQVMQDPSFEPPPLEEVTLVKREDSNLVKDARAYFRKQLKIPASPRLQAFFTSHHEAKPRSHDRFIEGLLLFIRFANSQTSNQELDDSRVALFGNKYSGLHLHSDLINMWCEDHREPATGISIDDFNLLPTQWKRIEARGRKALVYCGAEPAQALDALMKGPSTIDPGIFIQLGLWFAIRYVVGNERFNEYFGRSPLFLTPIIDKRIENCLEPTLGNPLHPFLSRSRAVGSATVILRSTMTQSDRPCFVIGGQAYVVDPARSAVRASNNTMSEATEPELFFDFDKLLQWLERIENNYHLDLREFEPANIVFDELPKDLTQAIPFENKEGMSFAAFKIDTPKQYQLITRAKQFCLRVLRKESVWLSLSGNPGIGKTASAVCAAKELAARGKKVLWISDVVVTAQCNQAKSMGEYLHAKNNIGQLLDSNPDAIFLDDDNLSNMGIHLLETIYTWYASAAGRAVYITSNTRIKLDDCFDYSIESKQSIPPFVSYDSPQFLHWQSHTQFDGANQRAARDGQSIGAVMSADFFQKNSENLGELELIPSFDDSKELAPIRCSLYSAKVKGPKFDALRPIQKKWLECDEACVNPRKFFNTHHKTIAIELNEYRSEYFKTTSICSLAIDQLVRVINYVHDVGGKRVLLINQTGLTTEDLLRQIKQLFPALERERLWARLMCLLCETEASILSRDEFKGLSTEKQTTCVQQREVKGFDLNFFKGIADDLMVADNSAEDDLILKRLSGDAMF